MIEVKIHGSFAEHGGYGKVNRNLAKGLSDLGVAVYLDPIKKNELAGGIIASSPINKQVSKNAISIDSIVPTIGMESFGRYRILYTTIESRTIPQSFVDQANTYNEVWVTSDFCAGVLKNHGCKKTIFVLPDSINIDMYNIDGDIHDFMPQLKQFVFISVMGWNYRKGYDVLLKAYLSTFTGDSDVSLLLLTRHFSKQQEPIKKAIDEFIKSYGGDNPPHIVRCHKIIPEAEMPSWYRAADAFVLFSRGEGFCTLPDANIKTTTGIKKICDIKLGEYVFSHNGKSNKVIYTVNRPYKGQLIKLSCYGRSNNILCLTPNHRIRVIRTSELPSRTKQKLIRSCSYNRDKDRLDYGDSHKHNNDMSLSYNLEWARCDEVKPGDYLFYPLPCRGNDKKTVIDFDKIDNIKKRFNIESEKIYKIGSNQHHKKYKTNQIILDYSTIKITNDLMKLFGYYVAEGCSVLKDGLIAFAFHTDEKEYHNEVDGLMHKCLHIQPSSRQTFKHKKCVVLKYHNTAIAELLTYLFGSGARYKNIPQWFYSQNDSLKIKFICGILNGDGCYSGKTDFSTSSIDLANALFDLYLSLGITSTIKTRNIENKQYYSVKISNILDHNKLMDMMDKKEHKLETPKSQRKKIKTMDGGQLLQIKSVESVEYDGDVYNLTVENDNSYICENIAVHNCLPAAEASLCGCPVISTNYSGQTMFLNNTNSYLLRIDRFSKTPPGLMYAHYWDDQEFPSLTSPASIKEAGGLLKTVAGDNKERTTRNNRLRKKLQTNYSIKAISQKAKDRLEKIWSKL